jgi:sulfite reductase (ferredoxin)
MSPETQSPKSQRQRDEGQWALGSREPLNANEAFKAADDGLNVRDRIIEVYSKQGFASIPAEDLRGRMRWWGLYTQRRPGIPGGRTASLAPEELDDEFFMMRVRSDGGALTSAQARVIGGISTDFARNTADISDRQNIQLHWIRIEDVPEIWQRLEAVGLGTTEACGDTPRVVLGSPVAGVAADEILDATPAIEEIVRRAVGNPAYSNLPRKFKSAISGSPRQDVAHEINDVSFLGVVHPEHGPGFDVWVGGGLSTNPRLAVRLGAWVPLAEVPDVWEGILGLFRDYGYRRMRTKARLKYLVAAWGPEQFRQVLEQEYLDRPLLDGPEPPPPAPGARDHVGIHPQRDGRCYVGAAPTVGRVSGTILAQVADLAEQYGSGRIRLTPHQKLVILDVAVGDTAALAEGLGDLGLRTSPSAFRQSAMACTGIEYCKLAISETKARASDLVDELERRLPDFDEPIAIHVNGCPNSCARFQVADIGLKGVLVPGEDPTEGFQVHLGGSLGQRTGFGTSLRGHRLAGEELADYVERVLRAYLAERNDGEAFAQWTTRAAEEALR